MSELLERILQIPSIDSHEHIGSIRSIDPACFIEYNNFTADMYPGIEPMPTTVFDILPSACYLAFTLFPLGYSDPQNGVTPYYQLSEEKLQLLWDELVPYLIKSRGTGFYMAHDIAYNHLYSVSLDDLIKGKTDWRDLNSAIMENYKKGMFQWCKAVFKKANINYAVKPVHNSYIKELNVEAKSESFILETQLFKPILRIENSMDISGVESIEKIENIIDDTFHLLKAHNIKATKQAQAYLRPLSFMCVERDSADKAFKRFTESSDEKDLIIFKDYIMGLILNKSSEMKLSHQVHTGIANLPNSNPVLLREAIEMYPEVNFILLHCYPYFSEAAFMARTYKNVYLDASFLEYLSPGILYNALNEWIGAVPYSKICLSGDAVSVEECYGGMQIIRRVLANVLNNKIQKDEIDEELAIEIAEALLYKNSAQLYGTTVEDYGVPKL